MRFIPGAWKVHGRCVGDAQVCGWCTGGTQEVHGRCMEGVWEVHRRYVGGVQKMYRRCMEGDGSKKQDFMLIRF